MLELTVVVRAFDRIRELRRLLDLLAKQTLSPAEFEVVVVVDEPMGGIAQIFVALDTPYELRVARQGSGGAARNAGVAAARGEYCVFIDEDFLPEREMLAAHLRTMREREDAVSLGATRTVVPEGADWFARRHAEELDEQLERFGSGELPPRWSDFQSGNLGVSRRLIERVGGFREGLGPGEEIELGYRLEASGARILFTREAVAVREERRGMPALLRDFEARGAAAVEIRREHPATLPDLVRAFGTLGRRGQRLRWALLETAVPPHLAATLGSISSDVERRRGLYRFAKSLAYCRGIRRGLPDRESWRSLTGGTPILMYHAFAGEGEPAGRYIVPIRKFRAQMALLRLLRYRVMSLGELVDHLRNHRLAPSRSVVITIDDGYADNFRLAYPVLRRHGYPATIFMVTGKAGGRGDWDFDGELSGRPLMDWEAIREMSEGSIEFAGHTRTHPRLTALPPGEAREEVIGSRDDLERELGVPVRHFAYPHGDHDEEVARLVEDAGFHGTCGVRSGLNRAGVGIHELRRTEIFGTDTLPIFAAKLRTGASDALGAKRRRPVTVRADEGVLGDGDGASSGRRVVPMEIEST